MELDGVWILNTKSTGPLLHVEQGRASAIQMSFRASVPSCPVIRVNIPIQVELDGPGPPGREV